MTVSTELSRYRLDLVEIQEVRWEGSGTELAEFASFYGKLNENYELRAGFFPQNRITSAVQSVKFVSDRCHT
jgi:hypothetical protein